MESEQSQVNLSLSEVYDLSLAALVGCGSLRINAQPVAESIRDAEADGIRNVGLNYFVSLLRSFALRES